MNRSLIPADTNLHQLADFFKIFGDYTRVRIIYLLTKGEMTVHGIAGSLGMEQSAISHQLRILKQARLVRYSRSGRWKRYSLSDSHIERILSQGLKHLAE